jgi:hypothetical protein
MLLPNFFLQLFPFTRTPLSRALPDIEERSWDIDHTVSWRTPLIEA